MVYKQNHVLPLSSALKSKRVSLLEVKHRVLDLSVCASPRQQSEEVEKNGSGEEEDEEKPGKRVMGPRKKFVWDDKLR